MTALPTTGGSSQNVESPRAHEPRHYAFLDALRGIAALGVVAVHTVQNFHAPGIESIVGCGQYGVQLFYIVSAFSLCLSLAQRRKEERRPNLNYAIRRFFRIAPLFYLAVVVYLTKPFWLPATSAPVILDARTWSLRPWHVVATVLFLNGWHYRTINSIVPGGWSVAVETGFYVLLPFLFRLATSLKRTLWLLVGALLASMVSRKAVYLLFASHVPASDQSAFGTFVGMWLPAQLPVFILGIIMFNLWVRSGGAPSHGRSGWSRRLTFHCTGLVLTSILAWVSPPALTKVVSQGVQISLACLFFCLILADRPFSFFVNRVTNHLGKISYSIYLFHFVALHVVLWGRNSLQWPTSGSVPRFLLAFVCVVALTCAAAELTFRLVERRGQDLGRRLIRSLQRRSLTKVAD